jgi:hypothetical protein
MMVPVVMAMASAATSNYKIPFNGRHQVLDLTEKKLKTPVNFLIDFISFIFRFCSLPFLLVCFVDLRPQTRNKTRPWTNFNQKDDTCGLYYKHILMSVSDDCK